MPMSRQYFPALAALTAVVILGAVFSMNNDAPAEDGQSRQAPGDDFPAPPTDGQALATFGGGCFWCTEAVYDETEGVIGAVSGYSGGQVINPSYEAVCTGQTGHAEVIQVTYDPEVISYKELLEIFFRTHDPTTLNQQGADRGTQYRSVIYYHDDEQKQVAEEIKTTLDASGAFRGPIVTEISPLDVFYAAEAYHQNYFAKNPYQGYCQAVIAPKMAKYRAAFAEKLKSE